MTVSLNTSLTVSLNKRSFVHFHQILLMHIVGLFEQFYLSVFFHQIIHLNSFYGRPSETTFL